MKVNRFSERTLQYINQNGEYYVYGLIDPRDNKLFYIGKGTGNRVFQHVAESNRNPEMVIKINKTYNRNISPEELYNSVRGIWRANINRVQKVEYVLGVYNNLIVACYKPEKWYKLDDSNAKKLPKSMLPEDWTQIEGRVFFESDYLSKLDDAQKFYLYKSIEGLEYIQKSQNPIMYIGI